MAQEQLRPGGVLFEMKRASPGHCIRLSHKICSFFLCCETISNRFY